MPAHWPAGLLDQLHVAHSRWSTPAGFAARRYAGTTFCQLISEVVTEVERELGRTVVFRLELIQISEELMASRNVLAPLESVIRELAR